jgi:hypothetical protein
MKKYIFLAIFALGATWAMAQTSVKKYALIEHYTNTRCGSCGASNPGFYTKLGNKLNTAVNHISYHPSFPYSSCVLYKANTSENDARANYNTANFTPSYIINGKGGMQNVVSFTDAILTSEIAKTSPLEVKVKEISGVAGWTANIKLKNYGSLTGANYVLMVALCEKTLNYTAPNGEKVHHDVFRKMISNVNGNPLIAMPTKGQEAELNLNYTLDASWKASEMYVIAWVVDPTTKEVINSGTKFTTVVGTNDLLESENVSVYPNPAQDFIQVDLSKTSFKATSYEVFNSLGQIVLSGAANQENLRIDIAQLPINQYLVKINSAEGSVVKAFVKQ